MWLDPQCGLRANPNWCDISEGHENHLHDTATERTEDIDLKSSIAEIRFPSVVMALRACTLILFWGQGTDERHLHFKQSRLKSSQQQLTLCPLPPFILSCCDNRDIPELTPCLAVGLSLNSAGVCGMLDRWVEWSRGMKRKWKTFKKKKKTWALKQFLLRGTLECPRQGKWMQWHVHKLTIRQHWHKLC